MVWKLDPAKPTPRGANCKPWGATISKQSHVPRRGLGHAKHTTTRELALHARAHVSAGVAAANSILVCTLVGNIGVMAISVQL